MTCTAGVYIDWLERTIAEFEWSSRLGAETWLSLEAGDSYVVAHPEDAERLWWLCELVEVHFSQYVEPGQLYTLRRDPALTDELVMEHQLDYLWDYLRAGVHWSHALFPVSAVA